ncbi:amidohydrolase family protein [Ochrobactrum sp. SFR4]|uniref:amidohydrolase family protein n=1 Tax=Ochrobactrum sp. SFR4 TaxID=2717368 RepID=UPI001C8C399F|nr:amidohydrolase family protein [Ochrobactrum sp. SFR4]MBX8824392.1 amidohydrolase family protein [Ochrobactrum sp. SFR4]
MTITRKELFRLGIAGLATAAATGGSAAASPAKPAEAKKTHNPQPSRATLIRNADILTMDTKLGELTGMDVLIKDGKIAAIAKGMKVDDAEVIDATGKILMPGMIDGHRHVWQIMNAGMLVKTHAAKYDHYQTWKERTVVCMTPEDFHLAGYVGGLLAIDSGVTSVVDYAHGQHNREKAFAGARGLIESGVGGVFCYQIAHSTTYGPGDTISLAEASAQRLAPPTEEHYETARMLRDELFSSSDSLIRFGIASSNGLGRHTMRQTKTEFDRARALEPFLIALHIHKQNPVPPEGIYRNISDLYKAGLLGPEIHVSHGVQMTDEEIIMLRDTGGMLCATVMGEFPYVEPAIHGKARKMGLPSGIGIDVNLALTQDYFEHVRAALWNMQRSEEYARIAREYEPTDLLDFATNSGAKAIRMGDTTGTISVGKQADLVLLSTSRYGLALAGTLADRVFSFANLSDVDSVWVRGTLRKQNGKMLNVDWDKLKKDMREAQARIVRDAATINFT